MGMDARDVPSGMQGKEGAVLEQKQGWSSRRAGGSERGAEGQGKLVWEQ